ncbi:MAG: [protein-PII] uridylyltransferase [Deltaproteobacteria bacterium]|nr:[protein-PII] uridylyltransferase [Deltaproteobacteria bacterium]
MSEPLHKKYLSEQLQKLKRQHDQGEGGGTIAGRHASFIDVFIISVFNSLEVRALIGLEGEAQSCVVMGLGGYGRKELSPFSDIDLLFLYPEKNDPKVEEAIRKVLYPLWDVGYDLGYSVQSMGDCLELARSEPQFLTALLDARRITGNPALALALKNQIGVLLKEGQGLKWQEWILTEREKRHLRYGDSAFFLEPHLKEGLGGLRDIHILLWIGKALLEAPDFRSLEKAGFLSGEDRDTLIQSQNFLLRLRNQLHYLAGRRTDQLSFEFQEAMAEWAAIKPQGDILPVEVFMRDVYRHLQSVQTIHQNFFERLTEQGHKGEKQREIIEPGIFLEGGRIYLESAKVILDNPSVLMKLFWYALKKEARLSQETIRLIKQCLYLVDENFQHSRMVSELFLDIIKDLKTPRELLETMLQTGLLTKYIPEFEATVCRTQFDTYHVYTVDIHLLLTLVELKKIGQGFYMKEEPLLFGIWGEIEDFSVLYLSGLFHDLGKGQGKNHAQQGALMIAGLAERLKLPLQTAKAIAYQVKNHLLLVETALRRDLNDEELMVRLAQLIEKPSTLKMLYLLSYADALATGGRAWNNWKSLLLKELFFKVLHILEKGEWASGLALETLEASQKQVIKLLKNDLSRKEVQDLLEGMPSSYLLSIPPESIAKHLRLLRQMEGKPFLWLVEKKEELYEIFICCHDRPGLFSRLTGVFSLNNINILGAQIFTRPDRIALDIFQVNPPLDPLFAEETWERVYDQLSRAISGKLSLDYRLAQKKPGMVLSLGPRIIAESQVIIDNHGSDFCSIIEVYTQDRLGLLYTITKTLSEMELNISFAKISTKIDQVVDVFYVTDLDGQKIYDEERLEEIKKAILFALTE